MTPDTHGVLQTTTNKNKSTNSRKKGNMPSLGGRDFARGNHGHVIHGGVDADNHVGIVRGHAPANLAFAGKLRVNIRHEFPGPRIGQVVQKAPLVGVGRQMLVRVDQGTVGQATVLGPNVQQIVRRAGKVHFKLLGQGFGRRPVSPARVGRQEQDFEWAAVLRLSTTCNQH